MLEITFIAEHHIISHEHMHKHTHTQNIASIPNYRYVRACVKYRNNASSPFAALKTDSRNRCLCTIKKKITTNGTLSAKSRLSRNIISVRLNHINRGNCCHFCINVDCEQARRVVLCCLRPSGEWGVSACGPFLHLGKSFVEHVAGFVEHICGREGGGAALLNKLLDVSCIRPDNAWLGPVHRCQYWAEWVPWNSRHGCRAANKQTTRPWVWENIFFARLCRCHTMNFRFASFGLNFGSENCLCVCVCARELIARVLGSQNGRQTLIDHMKMRSLKRIRVWWICVGAVDIEHSCTRDRKNRFCEMCRKRNPKWA